MMTESLLGERLKYIIVIYAIDGRLLKKTIALIAVAEWLNHRKVRIRNDTDRYADAEKLLRMLFVNVGRGGVLVSVA
jgi:hypothetical protein